ncbi:MAG: (2Fe-2S)-binding protein [Sedimentitalea sp.]
MALILEIDGEKCEAAEGETLATVLFRHHPLVFGHHPVDGAPRSAFCMIGVCFECLVEVNGIADQQSCMIAVRDGMIINRTLR